MVTSLPAWARLRAAMGVLALVAVLGAQPAGAQSAGIGDDRPVIAALDTGRRAELQRAVDAQLAASRGGRQSAANEITFGGGVVMVLPLPGEERAPVWSRARGTRSATADWKGCPDDTSPSYYCFYADINWGGRRLQFSALYEEKPVMFSDYGFQDQTSSWVNTGKFAIIVDGYGGGGQWSLLWREPPASLSASVQYGDTAQRFWAVRN